MERELVPAGEIRVEEIRLRAQKGAVRNVFTRTGIWTNLQRANATVFATLDQFMLQTPTGVADPATVKRVYQRIEYRPHELQARSAFSYSEVQAMAVAMPPGARAVGYITLNAPGSQLRPSYVLGDYFGVLGVHPLIGRFFAPGEFGRETGTRLAVVSERF